MTVMGAFLPRMPAAWALPLSALVLVSIVLAAFHGPGGEQGARGWAAT
jgi:hypothetical protein